MEFFCDLRLSEVLGENLIGNRYLQSLESGKGGNWALIGMWNEGYDCLNLGICDEREGRLEGNGGVEANETFWVWEMMKIMYLFLFFVRMRFMSECENIN